MKDKKKMCPYHGNKKYHCQGGYQICDCPKNVNNCEIITRKPKPRMVKIKAWACITDINNVFCYNTPCHILIKSADLKKLKGGKI